MVLGVFFRLPDNHGVALAGNCLPEQPLFSGAPGSGKVPSQSVVAAALKD